MKTIKEDEKMTSLKTIFKSGFYGLVLISVFISTAYAGITVFSDAAAIIELNKVVTIITVEEPTTCQTIESPKKTVTSIEQISSMPTMVNFELTYTANDEQVKFPGHVSVPVGTTREQLKEIIAKECDIIFTAINKNVINRAREVTIIYPDLLSDELYDLDTKTWSRR